jgi:16S rRNA processing protein RimM
MNPAPWHARGRANTPADLAAVGEVLTTQGNKGELKVRPLTDDPQRWSELTRVFFCRADAREELTVERVRYFRGFVVVKFKEINSLTEAEKLRGGFLCIPLAERRPLPAGSYYFDQILGLSVLDETGSFLGKVEDILPTGANDVYVVRGGPHGEFLLPALKSVVLTVDLAAGAMKVRLPAGLVDEDDGER